MGEGGGNVWAQKSEGSWDGTSTSPLPHPSTHPPINSFGYWCARGQSKEGRKETTDIGRGLVFLLLLLLLLSFLSLLLGQSRRAAAAGLLSPPPPSPVGVTRRERLFSRSPQPRLLPIHLHLFHSIEFSSTRSLSLPERLFFKVHGAMQKKWRWALDIPCVHS